MRQITFYLAGFVLLLIGLVQHILRGNLNFVGGVMGLIGGVLFGAALLRRAFHLARSGIFVDTSSPRERKVIIFVLFPVCIVLGAAIPLVNKLYLPQFDFMQAYGSGFLLFFFISSGIGLLGTYLLERRYRKRFYIGKWKKCSSR